METGLRAVSSEADDTLGNPDRVRAKILFRDAMEVGRHTIAFIVAILSIWLVHLVLEWSLGKDAQFYDRIPVRYVIDTGHLAVLVRFVWELVRQIGRRP